MKTINFDSLLSNVGYTFNNKNLLYEAFTHRSYSNENIDFVGKNNERLEFLGDSVMDLITSEYLYSIYPEDKEGELSKFKSQIISEAVFASIARDLNLGDYLFLSKGEIQSGGRNRNSLLGDVFEAFMGAIFVDSNYEKTKEIALKLLIPKIKKIETIDGVYDYKTNLQELTQLKYKVIPLYEIVNESGPDHDKNFEAIVKVGDVIFGRGYAKSKKNAEKKAAYEAIKKIKGEK